MKKNMKNDSLLSVIISTRNEDDVIEILLKSLKKQTYKNIEIVVVDNNSTDTTKSLAKHYTKYVYNHGPERSAQRNFGAKKANGKYLLFLDADMELTPNVIKECIQIVEKDKKVGGIIIPEISVGKRFWERVKAFERAFYFEEGGIAIESARFFDKNIFTSAKGYDGNITGTEDWDLSERVRNRGYKILRTSSPLYHHETIPSLKSIAEKYYYYGLTAHRTLSKQNTPIIGPKTIQFLRPVFYKKFYRFLMHPLLGGGVFLLLSTQVFSSGLGFVVGKIKRI